MEKCISDSPITKRRRVVYDLCLDSLIPPRDSCDDGFDADGSVQISQCTQPSIPALPSMGNAFDGRAVQGIHNSDIRLHYDSDSHDITDIYIRKMNMSALPCNCLKTPTGTVVQWSYHRCTQQSANIRQPEHIC